MKSFQGWPLAITKGLIKHDQNTSTACHLICKWSLLVVKGETKRPQYQIVSSDRILVILSISFPQIWSWRRTRDKERPLRPRAQHDQRQDLHGRFHQKTIMFTSLYRIKRMSDRTNFHYIGKTGLLQVLWFWYGFLILMGLFRTIDRVAQILSWRFRFGRLVVILTFSNFAGSYEVASVQMAKAKILKTTFDFT